LDAGAMTLILTKRDIAELMSPTEYLEAVETAFRLLHQGAAHAPPPLHLHGHGGALHAKGATLSGYAAVKINANFPGNRALGLPTIQGVIALFDAQTGALLALLDSIEVTLRRTAAATALAAKHCARGDAGKLAIIGCGAQAAPQLEALTALYAFSQIAAFDLDPSRVGDLAGFASERGWAQVHKRSSPREAAWDADIVVTCTTAQGPILDVRDISPGTFVAAVGADNPGKNEIAPNLMAHARVVTDVTAQCADMGDLRHAIAAGAMRASDVHAELGDLVSGAKPGRRAELEIFVFDSTGTAIQDVASAAAIYERALKRGIGGHVDLADGEKYVR